MHLPKHLAWPVVATLLAGAGGCAMLEEEGLKPDLKFMEKPLDTIYGAAVKGDALIVQVPSNGCTDKASFGHDVLLVEDGAYTVKLTRIKEDTCEAFLPDGTEISYGFGELRVPAGARLTILNPLVRG